MIKFQQIESLVLHKRLSLTVIATLILGSSSGVLSLGLQSIAQTNLTRFGSVAELEGDMTCGRGTGGHYVYFENEDYRIYVCSDETDSSTPRFYRSYGLDGDLELSLIADHYNPREGRYLIFDNGGYSYILDPGTAQTKQAQLIVRDPNQKELYSAAASVYLTTDYDLGSGGSTASLGNSGCEPSESMFVEAETDQFKLYICGGDLPHSYVGIAKSNGSQIRLPLTNFDPQGTEFIAYNGDVLYTLTPTNLKVTQGSKILVDQVIRRWN